ncbi:MULTISPECIES: hypothetical protein [Burkholderia cepacia complex]|uniref:hypothetical protein n=1 Tax=Burkholderia cepacia complex TaxID=87882 RepID=UPI002656F181|nr:MULTISPECIES: hypothetical protein [Burkholderia cepacia complex]MDN7484435.1 hypothetical protein [Burkholderia orbicola]BEV54129.1 hypothetical protein BconGalA64_66290 [Burkholderia contaminans]
MDNIKHPSNHFMLTARQICDLATVVRENFGGNLSRADFTEQLLLLLEDVPGCELVFTTSTLIDSAWGEYNRYRFES